MDNENLTSEQQQLYNLILQANRLQTNEIKTDIQESLKELRVELEETKKELETVKEKYIKLERRNRKNNIVIFGVLIKDNLLEEVLTLINNLLGTAIKREDINNIYKLGKNEKAPIVLEFVSFLTKTTLFMNKENLRNLKHHHISIAYDLCPEDRKEQKILREHLKIARAQNLEAKIKDSKLYIDNKAYSVNELAKLDQPLEEQDNDSENSEEEIIIEKEESDKATTSGTVQIEENKLAKQISLKVQPRAENKTDDLLKTKRAYHNTRSPKTNKRKK